MTEPPRPQEHMGLVYALARRLSIPRGAWEDVIGAGLLGLVEAAARYDPARGTAFSTYAVPVILGEMRLCLRRMHPVTVGRRDARRAAALGALRRELEQRQGREPTLDQLAQQAAIPREEAAVLLAGCGPTLSVEAACGTQGLPDGSRGEEAWVDALAAAQALEQLEERQRELIRLRYFARLTQERTGRRMGLTQVQVSRMEKRALLALRRALEGGSA